jgi:iron complex transport system permease protein
MTASSKPLIKRLLLAAVLLSVVLAAALVLALSSGSGEGILRSLSVMGQGEPACAGNDRLAHLSAQGAAGRPGRGRCRWAVSFSRPAQPLAEPYILGISGGSAIGAIIGILLGLSHFPGVSVCAFMGSLATLVLIVAMSSGQSVLKKDALLLSGVMVNAFCASVIMFLVSMTQDARLHNIIFWLMGDLSSADGRTVAILAAILAPLR